MRQWNMSPETIASRETLGQWSIEDFLTKKVDTGLWVGHLVGNDNALAVNGLQTRRDVKGFLPEMLREMYERRVETQKVLKVKKRQLEAVKLEIQRRRAQ